MKVVGLYLSREYPPNNRGTIHVNGYHIGNWWRNDEDMKHLAGKYSFNRTGLALRINLPAVDAFDNLGDMLDWLRADLELLEMPADARP